MLFPGSLNAAPGPPSKLPGWVIKDLANAYWQLDAGGILKAGQRVTVQRNGMNMGMNNDGDTIFLINPDNETIDLLNYGQTSDDQIIVAEE
jgi:hypothetical protein